MDLLVLIWCLSFSPHSHVITLVPPNLQTISQGQTLLPLLEAKASVDVWKF